GGLCPHHGRVWRSLEAPALSSAVLLRDLLEHEMGRRLDGDGPPAPAGRWGLLRALGGGTPARDPAAVEPSAVRCPACEIERVAERRYLHALQRTPVADLEGALAGGRGFVCVAHVATLPEGPGRALLTARLEALLVDLDTFLRRSDHRFTHEPMGDAGDAWLRAIRAVGGDV
ncbi:MAG: hypothetical protein K0A98_02595, partial [Trueperaceae bacterium]|nr:hypothetical protein [Trueperaceae bacterium]